MDLGSSPRRGGVLSPGAKAPGGARPPQGSGAPAGAVLGLWDAGGTGSPSPLRGTGIGWVGSGPGAFAPGYRPPPLRGKEKNPPRSATRGEGEERQAVARTDETPTPES